MSADEIFLALCLIVLVAAVGSWFCEVLPNVITWLKDKKGRHTT